jgi:hypothetical protein
MPLGPTPPKAMPSWPAWSSVPLSVTPPEITPSRIRSSISCRLLKA